MIRVIEQCKKLIKGMRNILLTLLIFLFIQTTFAEAIDNSSDKGTLIVKIVGFANNNGECRFALDNLKDVFESDDSVYIGKVLPIVNGEVHLEFESLNFGNYAIKVFHDENSNGELDSNFLGIPSEDYGFSNNASAWFGPPSWEKATFLFNHKEMTIEISVE